jgi:hypothetical protein
MRNAYSIQATQILARPADITAYASGDLVANNTVAGSVTPFQFLNVPQGGDVPYELRRLQLRKSSNVITAAQFRVHLYSAAPVVTNGDNGALVTSIAAWLGFVDITIDSGTPNLSDGAAGFGVPQQSTARLNATNLYALLEARAAYTPVASETFQLIGEFQVNSL